MSTTGRPGADDGTAAAHAAALRSADFVRVLVRADGDALAAAGIVTGAMTTVDTPLQVSVAATASERRRRAASPADAAGDTATVLVGETPGADGRVLDARDRPASVVASEVARELDAPVDATLALAGTVAAGVTPGTSDTAALLEAAGLERRAGVAVPTADLAAGLAYSTLVRGSFSGDESAAGASLAELGLPADLDADAHRRVASAVALDATGGDASQRAATAVERFLRPYATPDGPFETLGGYADVLDALAATAPGTGVALALGHDVRADAVAAWRDHGDRVHRAVRDARTSRYDGVTVAQVESTARLVRDYVAAEPVALALDDDEAAAAGTGDTDVGAALRAAADAVDGGADGTATRAYARYDQSTDVSEFLSTFREAL
jgi:hypothetical protein